MKYTTRKLSEKILLALKNNPIVFINGPRQAGKSTLVRTLARTSYPAGYVSFDNAIQMAAVCASPERFLNQYKRPLILDEVQMVPDLFRVLKLIVDEWRFENKEQSKGRFLLTSSTNHMMLPQLSDALVGRMSIKMLYPFAACEVLGGRGNFLNRLFAADFMAIKHGTSLHKVISLATFPEVSGKESLEQGKWFDNYLTTLLQRDVRMIAELAKFRFLPMLLQALAARAGKLINDAEIARDIGLNSVTSKSYRSILQAMFLNFDVHSWYRNIGKRLVKSPKGYLIDTMLLCHLLGWGLDDLQIRQPNLYGHAVENFVATELLKLLSFSDIRAKLLHFCTSDNKEVDFVLERFDGSLAGIEVKTSSRIDIHDFKGIQVLQKIAKDNFVCGVVLYIGKDCVAFGDKLFAVPLAALWQ